MAQTKEGSGGPHRHRTAGQGCLGDEVRWMQHIETEKRDGEKRPEQPPIPPAHPEQ